MSQKMTKEQLEGLINETVQAVVGKSITDLRTENQSFLKQFAIPKAEAEKDKGLKMGRLIRALAAGKGDPDRAARIADKWFGEDNATSKALSSGDATAGGFLVGEEMSSEVIELLRPQAVVRRSNPVVMPMDRGSLTLPKITGGASSSYVGENDNGGLTEQTFGTVKLTFKKMVTLVPVSNDLLRFASYNADAIVRDDLVMSMANREDLAFIRGVYEALYHDNPAFSMEDVLAYERRLRGGENNE